LCYGTGHKRQEQKTDSIPLQPDLAKELKQYFDSNLAMPHIKAFTGIWKETGAEMLREDLTLR
jgi:hypothetical protein